MAPPTKRGSRAATAKQQVCGKRRPQIDRSKPLEIYKAHAMLHGSDLTAAEYAKACTLAEDSIIAFFGEDGLKASRSEYAALLKEFKLTDPGSFTLGWLPGFRRGRTSRKHAKNVKQRRYEKLAAAMAKVSQLETKLAAVTKLARAYGATSADITRVTTPRAQRVVMVD